MLEIFASLMLTWNHEIEPVEQVISCWSEIHDSPQQVERFCFFFFFQLMFPKSTLILLSVLFAMNQEFIVEGKKFWS